MRRIVRQHHGRFRLCYEKALRTRPDLQRRVVLSFTIRKDGSISNRSSSGSDLPDAAVSKCVLQALSMIELPAQEEASSVVVPLQFAPGS